MTKAIIGYTGFVGSNLCEQQKFDFAYNSKNIGEIRGMNFEHLIVSGVSAVKWLANKEPENDWKSISELIENLKSVTADRVTLISTVDVYPSPNGVDERTLIDVKNSHSYGFHRLKFEQFIQSSFQNTVILRLPGLFGSGLKKNIIFDYLNNNNVELIDTRHSFQFYDLKNLSSDIDNAWSNKINLLNISVEPITVAEVAEICLGHKVVNEVANQIIKYDFGSVYGEYWRSKNQYLYSLSECKASLKKFVTEFYND